MFVIVMVMVVVVVVVRRGGARLVFILRRNTVTLEKREETGATKGKFSSWSARVRIPKVQPHRVALLVNSVLLRSERGRV